MLPVQILRNHPYQVQTNVVHTHQVSSVKCRSLPFDECSEHCMFVCLTQRLRDSQMLHEITTGRSSRRSQYAIFTFAYVYLHYSITVLHIHTHLHGWNHNRMHSNVFCLCTHRLPRRAHFTCCAVVLHNTTAGPASKHHPKAQFADNRKNKCITPARCVRSHPFHLFGAHNEAAIWWLQQRRRRGTTMLMDRRR